MPYKLSEDGKCVMKMDGTTVKCHDTHAQAMAHMRALEVNVPEAHSILIDEFVNVKAGEPYRLFPFGKIVKNGRTREITPEFAATIKLPHFKAPIKLGSHEDTTPAGGHITALEVRADGLYAVPEFNDKGAQAITDGSYRYQSPEILWDGGLEDPATGDVISAPLIVGDALLHTPHLGEAAAMYSMEVIETNKESNKMNGDNFTVPTSFYEKFIAPLLAKPAEIKEVVKVVEPEDYASTKTALEQYKAQIETQKAEALRKSRVEKFETEIKATKADPTLAELLADMPEEKAALIMKQFKGLSEQINESELTGEKGSNADGGAAAGDPKLQFNAIVQGIAAEKGINYNAAMEVAKVSHRDLFLAWAAKPKEKQNG